MLNYDRLKIILDHTLEAAPVVSVGNIAVSLANKLCVNRTIFGLVDDTQAARPLCKGFKATRICSRRRTPSRKTSSSKAVQAFAQPPALASADENT